MDANEFQEACLRTLKKDMSWEQQITMLALGIAGESGEIVDELKKNIFHGREMDELKLKLEIGDRTLVLL